MGIFTMTLQEVMDVTDDIGLDAYPIFDESYRAGLNQKIKNHFNNLEIGQETISMFRFAMARHMNENMPIYNEHYKLSLLEVDVLSTVKVASHQNNDVATNNTSTSDSTGTSDAKSRAVASDFPQTALEDGSDYATNAQDNIANTTTTGAGRDVAEATQATIADSTTTGYQGHAPQLVMAARQMLVNVDMMVIESIREAGLFMSIWSSPSEFFTRSRSYDY